MRLPLAVVMGLCLPALSGCGSGARVRLAGDVVFEGQPLTHGTIVFTPVDPSAGPSTGGDIVDGRYDVPGEMGATPGVMYRVEITALAKSGKFIANPFDPKRSAAGTRCELFAGNLQHAVGPAHQG